MMLRGHAHRVLGTFARKSIFAMESQVSNYSSSSWHGTTILCVRKNGKVVMAGDGQVSAGPTVVKGTAKKS
jgi:ATP-dependent HslUV protease subunit HslV